MNIIYYQKEIIRTTKNGCKFYKYKYSEDFGKDTSYAYSWGCREKRGTGFIWAKSDEDFIDAINRKKRSLYI